MAEKPTENKSRPVAKIAATPPAKEGTDLFRAAYQERKEENRQTADDELISAQKEADKELSRMSEPPAVPKVTQEKQNDDKFKILFIFLIILTVVLFAASCIYLILGTHKKETETPSGGQSVTADMNSASCRSPFTYQQIYNVNFPDGIQEKYKALYAQNTDFVGWLTVPGTSIDTPVYKTDNNSYYLKHDNYDTYTKYGIPFLDKDDSINPLSRNTVIYGHNFDNKLIFDELHNYQNLDFYKENPVIEFNTLYKDYKWKVIAAFHSNGNGDGDNGYLFYYVATGMGNNNFMEFYDEIQQRSYIHTGVDVQPTDKILTLSTCTYFFDRNGSLENARFAVIARLVRDGESEEVDTSLASENDTVRYPQLYYDVFGGVNPYRNASKWVPSND